MDTKTASLILGIAFLLIGILGFIPNPIVGVSDNIIFHADTVHSVVHIVSGLLFLFFAFVMPASAPAFLKIFGAFYFLLGVLGLIAVGTSGEGTLLGFLHVNGADNFLHLGLGLIIFLAGMARPKQNVVA